MALRAQCHEKQLGLICKLFKMQLVAVQKATRKTACNKIQVQFTEASLGPKAQDEARY